MPAVPLTLATLGELNNGAAEAIVNAALAAAVRDTDDRGGDDKPRKVTITVTLTKISESDVAVEVDAKATVPAYRTDRTIGRLGYADKGVSVLFQPAATAGVRVALEPRLLYVHN